MTVIQYVHRLVRLTLNPALWPRLADEPITVRSLLYGVIPLMAAIGPVASMLAVFLFGAPVLGAIFRPAPELIILSAGLGYVGALAAVLALALLINVFAEVFDARPSYPHALFLTVAAFTPGWLAGAILILPPFGILVIAAKVYGGYLLYAGLPAMMLVSKTKTLTYGIMAVGVFLLIWGVGAFTSAQVNKLVLLPVAGSGLRIEGVGDVNIGQAQDAIRDVRAAIAKGQGAEDPAVLATFLPAALPGDYQRGAVNQGAAKLAGLSVAMASGTYEKGETVLVLEIDDLGAAGGLASAITVKESLSGKPGKVRLKAVDNRIIAERNDPASGENEYGVLIAKRFMLRARGKVGMPVLQAAIETLPMDRLKALAGPAD